MPPLAAGSDSVRAGSARIMAPERGRDAATGALQRVGAKPSHRHAAAQAVPPARRSDSADLSLRPLLAGHGGTTL